MLCVDYITTKEALKNLGITYRIVMYHYSIRQINNLVNIEKTADRQYRDTKIKDSENK